MEPEVDYNEEATTRAESPSPERQTRKRGRSRSPDDASKKAADTAPKDFFAAERTDAEMAGGGGNAAGRTGGVYIPPHKLRAMQKNLSDRSSAQFQRMSWDALRKSINGLINKVCCCLALQWNAAGRMLRDVFWNVGYRGKHHAHRPGAVSRESHSWSRLTLPLDSQSANDVAQFHARIRGVGRNYQYQDARGWRVVVEAHHHAISTIIQAKRQGTRSAPFCSASVPPYILLISLHVWCIFVVTAASSFLSLAPSSLHTS